MTSEPQAVRSELSRWPTYQPMVLVMVAFAGGVCLDRFCLIPWYVWLISALGCLAGWLMVYRTLGSKNDVADHNRHVALASTLLLIGLVCVGAFWHHGRWNWFGESELGRFATGRVKPCCIEAIATSEPRLMAVEETTFKDETARTKIAIRVTRIRDGKQWIDVSGISDLIIHGPTRHVQSGDRIRVFGQLVPSSPPTNPGQYDFRKFYRAKSKLAFVHAINIESVEVIEPAGWAGAKLLSTLRQKLNELTWTHVHEDEAALASAILLGNREQLSKTRRDTFFETGTVHLLAISGLHVGILAGTFFMMFRIGLLSRKKCLWATIFFVIFYAWLVEFRPPVSRAAILIVLFCIGRLCGERGFSFNLLAIAGLIVLILNPCDLFAIGPQLSFLAVATLTFGKDWVFWSPSRDPIKRLVANTRPAHVRTINWFGRKLRAAVLVSALIWLVAMPLVAFRFHLVAPIALVVNPILLVPIAWALYGGLGVLVLGWFAPSLANIFGWFCHLNLGWIEAMVAVAQSIPLGHSWTAGPTEASIACFYLGVFLFAVYPPTRLPGRWLLTLTAVWLVFTWFVPDQFDKWCERTTEDAPLCLTVIDVGHGSSALIQLPDGKNMIYDAGALGSAEYGARNIAGVLWSERIEHVDAVVLSHADVDHFNALAQLTEQFSIGVVYMSRQMRESQSSAVASLIEVLNQKSIPIREISARDRLLTGSHCSAEVLGPPIHGTGDNDNSDSVVLMLECSGRKVLLPGDLERAGLSLLFQQEPIDFDIVVAAHHGSKNSQPEEFMKWSTPEFVAISGGRRRVSDAAVQKFEAPGRKIGRTDYDGAIRFQIDGSGVTMKRWNHEPWE